MLSWQLAGQGAGGTMRGERPSSSPTEQVGSHSDAWNSLTVLVAMASMPAVLQTQGPPWEGELGLSVSSSHGSQGHLKAELRDLSTVGICCGVVI